MSLTTMMPNHTLALFMLATFLTAFSVANKMQPHYRHDEQQPHESVMPVEQSQWISGPGNNKYQFHIGKQSWLAAREKCLAQNADLVTIGSKEEMEWLLTHYRPQFPYLRERQVQIGLLLEAPEGDEAQAREWTWVDGKQLDVNIMKWTQGEPFDHAKGKERCALLNINEKRIDDIDCDLSAGAEFNYRFVCQRSHQKHIEHESLNNPLWKKLEDILTFFGISSSDKEEAKSGVNISNGLNEEGYWDRVFRGANNSLEQKVGNGTKSSDVDGTHPDGQINLIAKEITNGDLKRKGEELAGKAPKEIVKKAEIGLNDQVKGSIKGKEVGEEKKSAEEKEGRNGIVQGGESIEGKSEGNKEAISSIKQPSLVETSKEAKLASKIIGNDDEVPNKFGGAKLDKVADNLVAASIDSKEDERKGEAKKDKIKPEDTVKKEEKKEEKKEQKKEGKVEEKKKEEKAEEKNEGKVEEKKGEDKAEEKKEEKENKVEENKEEKREGMRDEKKEQKKEEEEKSKKTEDNKVEAKNLENIVKNEGDKTKEIRKKENRIMENVEKKEELAVEKQKVEINKQKEADKEAALEDNKIVEEGKNIAEKKPEAIIKEKKAAIVIQDKHEDGRHGSNEGLEIVTEKKAKEQQTAPNAGDKTMILLASAEEKSLEKPVINENAGGECSRANSAACIRAHEPSLSENTNASMSDNIPVALIPPKPVVLHAIGSEDRKSNGTVKEKGEAKEERKEKMEKSQSSSSSSSSVAKPTKPDPISIVAETLERTLSSKEESSEDETVGKKKGGDVKTEKEEGIKWRSDGDEEGQRKNGPVQSRIKHLEQIITAVQQMMGFGGGEEDDGHREMDEKNKRKKQEAENRDDGKSKQKEEKKEERTEVKKDEKRKSEENPSGEVKQEEKILKKEENKEDEHGKSIKKKSNSLIAEAEEKSKSQSSSAESAEVKQKTDRKKGKSSEDNAVHESMMAMEGDFEEAEKDGKAHPGINSGDLVKNIIISSEEEKDCVEECEEEEEEDEGMEKKMNKKGKKEEREEVKQALEVLNSTKEESEKKSRIEKYGRKIGRKEDNEEQGNEERLVVSKGSLPIERLETKQIVPDRIEQVKAKVLIRPPTPDEHILDQLANQRRALSGIREGDEIGHSSARKDNVGDGKNGNMKESKVELKAADDWVIQLNKSVQNEPEEEGENGEAKATLNENVHSSSPLPIFPRPDFALIQRGIPKEVEQHILEERSRVDKVYELFNTKESVYDLIRRIQQAEAASPLSVNQSKSLSNEIGKNIDQENERSKEEDAGNKIKEYISAGIFMNRP